MKQDSEEIIQELPDYFQLSHSQEGIWLSYRTNPESFQYNLACAIQGHKILDFPRLKASVELFVANHSILRMRLLEIEGSTYQYILPQEKLEWEIISLLNDDVEEAQKVMAEDARKPYDLFQKPVFRVYLYKTPTSWFFQFAVHHIAMDGLSGEILVEQVIGYYLYGQVTILPQLRSYREFVGWQRSFADTPAGESQALFWKNYLDGFTPSRPEAPLQIANASVQMSGECHIKIAIPEVLYSRIKVLQKQSGCTPFTILLAAYALVLGRYNGQSTQYCLIPSYNRPEDAYFKVVGHFVNNVLLRIQIKAGVKVIDYLRSCYASLKEVLRHQSYPIHKVLNDLGLKTFQEKEAALAIGFGWLRQERGVEFSSDFTVLRSEQYASNSDWLMTFYENFEELHGELHVGAGRYPASMLTRLIEDYLVVLEGLCDFSDRSLAELPLMKTGHIRLLQQFQAGPVMDLSSGTLMDRFQQQILQRSNQSALYHEGHWITYGQLNDRATQIAHGLKQRGVERGSIVAVAQDRSCELIASLLAILKVGAAYLPIDPTQPIDRIQFIVSDSGLRFVLISREYEQKFAVISQALAVENLLTSNDFTATLESVATPEDICYVVYTSGSSGRPKGVAVSHRAILNQVDALNVQHELHSQDTVGSFTTISFDIFAAEFLLPLSNGIRLALLDTEAATDPVQLGQFIKQADVTFFLCTPIILRSLVGSPWPGSPRLQVLCGGEAFPNDLIESLQGKFKAVWNGYGPTEATVCATAKRISQVNDGHSIGRPFLNYQVSVRDPQQRCLAIGGLGEICIGGPSLASFYLGRDELNLQKFIEDPEHPGLRLYRTGDLGLWQENGELRILGRLDNQVKIRGIRIELGEIESLLGQHPLVDEALVTLYAEQSSLVATIVPVSKSNADDAIAELRASAESWLRKQLPDAMIPRYWQFLPSMPRLISGKIDHQAVLAGIELSASSNREVAPGNLLEESIEAIVCRVVGRQNFGVETPFFASGVESIQLMQIASEIKAVLQVQVGFKRLVDLGTIRQIARAIEGKAHCDRIQSSPLVHGSEQDHYPVSFSQRRMWVLQRLHPETIAYNMPVILQIKGVVDPVRMVASLETLFTRHDVLRTSFHEIDGELRAVIHPSVPQPLKHIDLRKRDKDEIRPIAQAHLREELAKPFNLAQAPLIRVSLIQLSDRESLLLVNKHHIISDQWSLGIFFKELTRLYQNLNLEPAILPIRYVDYAVWQKQNWNAQLHQQQLDYWTKQLAGVGVVEIRPDFPRPSVQTSSGGIIRLPLSETLIEGVLQLGRVEHLTPYMILLGCFQILLHKYTGLSDLQVGSPVANRTESPLANTIGTFVNTIVLRAKIDGSMSFLQFMDQIRLMTLDAFAHQDISFETLVQALGIERDMSHTPLVQVLFNVVNTPFELNIPEDWTVSLYDMEPVGAQFDLTMTVDYKVTKEILLNFNSDLYKRSTAERFLGHYLRVVQTVLKNPALSLADIEILEPAERQRILVDWNQTKRAWPYSNWLERLQQTVLDCGRASAVVSELGELSYQDLWQQSDQIAAMLLYREVKPGDFVGVYMDRVPLLLPILLGIMKAGAAYLPLDPHFPSQRVAYYLADSKARFLITDRESSQLPLEFKGLTLTTSQIKVWLKEGKVHSILPKLSADTLAYVIYTSGSTGQPKGVPIHHRALANFLFSMDETIGGGRQSKLLAVTSVSFDIHGLELFLPLLQGASLYLASKEQSISGQKLKDLIQEQQINVMQATPTTWRILLDAGWTGGETFTVLCGGEAFPRELLRALLPQVKTVWNLYGPTETTIWSTAHRLDSATDPLYIGKPIANTEIYILDDHHKPVPTQVTGELYIGGEGLSPGYLHRPDLTAERFIAHPIAGAGGGKLYRTGDIAVWHENGQLECLGRVDSQIKLNGFRIEIGEIEAHLGKVMDSQDLAVVLKKLDGGREALVGYVVPQGSIESFDATAILRRLGEFLPSYMVPSYLLAVDVLPLTPNLKVDYKALRTRHDTFQMASAQVGAQNAIESIIMDVWREVLGLDAIDRSANFFALGGDSIAANRMVLALSKKFETEIPLKLIFMDPTIQSLAHTLRSEFPVRDFRIVFPVQKAKGEHPLFLVPGAYDHASRVAGYENDILRYFANLLPHFPKDLSVYGLRMIGIYPDETPLFKVHDIAACYREEIRKIQPHGPYFLAGECVGGLIAYELAQQLQKDGEKIAYLGLYDTVNPTTAYRVRDLLYFILLRLRDARNVFRQFAQSAKQEKVSMLKRGWSHLRSLAQCFNRDAIRQAIVNSDYFYVFSLLRYRPGAFDGHVTLISNASYQDKMPKLNWDKVTIKELSLHVVPGNHVTRLSMHSQVLGRKVHSTLEQALSQIQEEEDDTSDFHQRAS